MYIWIFWKYTLYQSGKGRQTTQTPEHLTNPVIIPVYIAVHLASQKSKNEKLSLQTGEIHIQCPEYYIEFDL